MSNYTSQNYQFSKVKNHRLEASFAGGDISSDGGSLILMEADKRLGLTRDIAKLFRDNRDQSKVSHNIESMIKQRVYGIALGYEDLNDHDDLRKCPVLQTIVGRLADMASSSTLCRFENQSDRKLIIEAHKLIIDKFIDSHEVPPKELILDFDATDDQIHGNQENRFYHGYYKHDCFLPLYVFCGKDLLVSYLRSSKQDQAKHSWAILALLVKRFRAVWPEVRIVFRGDGGFCRHKMLDWCDMNNVHYVVGMSKNKRLNRLLAPTMELAQEEYDKTEEKQRYFDSFEYKAESWSYKRRIVGKAEITRHGENHRYIVTNLTGAPKELYDEVYCARGEMENRIKEQQLELFSDRTSCHKWWPNQLRLVMSGLAYILMQYIRSRFLQGTELAAAQVGTIRLKLLKIGAVIIRNTRRIKFLLSSSYPYQDLWNVIFRRMALD